MHKIEWHPKADAEFRDAGCNYEHQLEGLGRRFGQAVLTAIMEAANDPARYQRIDPCSQVIRVSKFPYSLVYQVKKESIRINAVMHHRRKPGYWKERFKS